jgi:diguanylate cyclase (GGDEF)-like protein
VIAEPRRTIASRLYLLGGLTLAAAITLAAVAVHYAAGLSRTHDALFEGGLLSAIEASEARLQLERHRRMVEAGPHAPDSFGLARKREAAEEAIQRIEHLAGRAGGALSTEVARVLPSLWRLGDEVFTLAEKRAGDQATVASEYQSEVERLQGHIRTHSEASLTAAQHKSRAAAAKAGEVFNALAGIALVTLLVAGALGAVELRAMLRRLNRVTDGMQRLARNDTDVRIEDLGGDDEVGKAALAVAVFKDNAMRLQQANRWLEVALSNMGRGLSMFDADRRLLICNGTYQRMYGLPDELTRAGTPFDRIVEHRKTLVQSVEGQEHEPLSRALSVPLAWPDTEHLRQRLHDGRIVEISAKALPWGGWVAMHEDVSERLAAAEEVERLARQDTLTGLANRHTLQGFLDKATTELGTSEGFALLVIDLDRFKEVNDALGPPAGDAVLAAVGRRLTDLARRGDLVGRLGGDEFAIIQRGVSDRSTASGFAERIIDSLHMPFHIEGQRAEIGATVGIALAPDDGRSASELMKNADLALYRAKLECRGTTRFYDPAMERGLRARRALEADLAHAVARSELELHYQPIVSLEERRVIGCEALIRWRHPERGIVPPGDFIPLAEESGLIRGIGAWALGEACHAAARWPGELRVAVNLSVAQFSGPDLAQITATALDASGLAPRRLELEVTESLLLGDDPETLELLHRLRRLGLGIALDDFGTGYSSLSHLRSFPFDKIKIDQTFVRDLPQMKNCEAIVGAVARLASSLDMTTVAEGVESEEHLSRVEAAGCDAVQGHLFSRPVPEERLVGVIAEIDARLAARGRLASA